MAETVNHEEYDPIGYLVRDVHNKDGSFYKKKPSVSEEDMSEFEICVDPVYLGVPQHIAPATVYKAISPWLKNNTFDADHASAICRAIAKDLSNPAPECLEVKL